MYSDRNCVIIKKNTNRATKLSHYEIVIYQYNCVFIINDCNIELFKRKQIPTVTEKRVLMKFKIHLNLKYKIVF